MSTAEILSLISTISYVVAGISFALAVYFWFSFKIPTVIGDLSGRTAKKSIAKMRANNEKSGGKGYGPSATNVNRGKLTDTMQHSKELKSDAKKMAESPKERMDPKMPETGLLESNKGIAEAEQQTAILESNEATGYLVDTDATVSLFAVEQKPVNHSSKKLTMIDEVMLIHTDEVI